MMFALLLIGCLGQDPGTEAHVNYTLDLGSLSATPPDSALVEVYVDGQLQKTYKLGAGDLENLTYKLDAVVCDVGDSLRVAYTLWSADKVIAEGEDAFAAVESAKASVGVLHVGVAGSSSSGGASSSSATNVTGNCQGQTAFTIGFKQSQATLSEGDTTLWLLIGGPDGATLGKPYTIKLKAIQGSGSAAADLAVDTEVLIEGDKKACDEIEVPITVVKDLLVEGPESAKLAIADIGGLASGTNQSVALTLDDGDSAWVSLDAVPTLTEPNADSVVSLTVRLHTLGQAKLAAAATVTVSALDGTGKAGTDYTFAATDVVFAAGAGNDSTRTVNLSLLANDYWETERKFNLQIKSAVPWLGVPAVVPVTLADNDYEYLVLLDANGALAFYSPLGEKQGSLGSALGGATAISGMGKDTLLYGNVLGQLFVLAISQGESIQLSATKNIPTTVYDLAAGPYPDGAGKYLVLATDASLVYSFTLVANSKDLSFLSNWNKAIAVAMSPLGGFPSYTANTGGEGYYSWTYGGSSFTQSSLLNAAGGAVDGGMAVSPSGAVLAKQKNGLYLGTVALAPEGVVLDQIKNVVATPRETFWLVMEYSDATRLTEIDAKGAVLRDIVVSGKFTDVTYVRMTKPFAP